MVRTMIAAVSFLLLTLAGCGGADDARGPDGPSAQQPPGEELPLPSNDDDPGRDDGSGWPRWKNPCPGPACDPYRLPYVERGDPPPDRERVGIAIDPQPPSISVRRAAGAQR